MEKQAFTVILTISVGLALGTLIVSNQSKNSLLESIAGQQAELVKGQEKLGQGLSGGNLAGRTDRLEARVSALEAKLRRLEAPARRNFPQPPVEDLSKQHDIEVDHTPVIGPKDAPITIVEFVDFECPFCARFHPPIAEVAKQYPGKVNYMLKNFPLSFHPNAKSAAKAAFAAGEQGKYSEMADALLSDVRNLNEERYEAEAKKLGLDVKKFMKDYKDKDAKWEEYIQKDMALGSKIGVRGTPTIFINGRKTSARDVASYKREIDALLKEKK